MLNNENPKIQESARAMVPSPGTYEAVLWAAYMFVMTFSSGMGGASLEAIEKYFAPGYPGEDLEPASRSMIRRLMAWIVNEDARIRQELRERERGAK